MRNASKTDQSCELLIEVSYVEQQNDQNNGMKCDFEFMEQYDDFVFILMTVLQINRIDQRSEEKSAMTLIC